MSEKKKIKFNEQDLKLLQELVSDEEPVKGNVDEDSVVLEFEPREK